MEVDRSMFTQQEMELKYKQYSGTLHRLCYSFLKNKADAEDAVHDTFIKLFKKENEFESSEPERGWLINTASNICKNILRRKDRIHERIEDHEVMVEAQTEYSEVADAILALPDKYKEVVYLYYYDELTTDEIARLLSLSPSTVRSQLLRARKLMRNILES